MSIEEKLVRLLKKPLSGIPTSNEKYRIIVVENYLIYYALNPITVMLIWDARRNPDDLEDEIKRLNP